MVDKSEYKTIRQHTQSLLDGGETEGVDFKESASSLSNEDLVAFANSPGGGYILVGVEEIEKEDGLQRGKINGCDVSDQNKLSILNRADSCRPPIGIDVVIENTNNNSFFCVHIPESEEKPHCTGSGTYKIRQNGENVAIPPAQLLTMFAQLESEKFIERFREATDEIDEELNRLRADIEQTIMANLEAVKGNVDETENEIKEELEGILGTVQEMEGSINRHLNNIFNYSESANAWAEEATNFSDETSHKVEKLKTEVDNTKEYIGLLEEKIDLLGEVLTSGLEIEDEYKKRKLEKRAKEQIRRTISKVGNLDKLNSEEAETLEKHVKQSIDLNFGQIEESEYSEYVSEQLEKWFDEVVEERRAILDRLGVGKDSKGED